MTAGMGSNCVESVEEGGGSKGNRRMRTPVEDGTLCASRKPCQLTVFVSHTINRRSTAVVKGLCKDMCMCLQQPKATVKICVCITRKHDIIHQRLNTTPNNDRNVVRSVSCFFENRLLRSNIFLFFLTTLKTDKLV